MFWSVVVGNVGQVYAGFDKHKAEQTYNTYVQISKTTNGRRASGESVSLWSDGDVVMEYVGTTEEDACQSRL